MYVSYVCVYVFMYTHTHTHTRGDSPPVSILLHIRLWVFCNNTVMIVILPYFLHEAVCCYAVIYKAVGVL